jgi:phosphomevalonate kinase
MLAGEYAVVGGHGPALAVALAARATVRLEPGGDTWRVNSTALGLEQAPVAEVPVLAHAVTALGSAVTGGGLLTVTSDLGAGPNKPGFGSSAAVCVAGLGALRAYAGLPAPTLAEAVVVHRAAQGGRGSGYDVATALHGGLCAYRNDPVAPTASSTRWLEGLHAAVLFTGRGAKTTDHLARLNAADGAEPGLRALGQAAEALLAAWEEGAVGAVLRSASRAERALHDLDVACDLGIRGGGIQEARLAIEAAGAVARTSGAGGGDCLWALAADEAILAQAVEAAEGVGCRRLTVGWPGGGLEVSG